MNGTVPVVQGQLIKDNKYMHLAEAEWFCTGRNLKGWPVLHLYTSVPQECF